MALKRSSSLDYPPAASPLEEESSSNEEDESSSSSSEETEETLSAKKSDSDSESGSDSASDSEEKNNSGVKPIASKPIIGTPAKSVKPKSKCALKSSAASSGKRISDVDLNLKDSKRARKKESENGVAAEKSEDTKKQLFQRLWSEEDEINVLEGMIEVSEKNGANPSEHLRPFLKFIKKSVHFPATLLQLKRKVFELKMKFENHVNGKQGENKTFTKSHDQNLFNLLKTIWGNEGIVRFYDLSKKKWGFGGSVKPSEVVKFMLKSRKGVNSNGGSKSSTELKMELARDEKVAEKVDRIDVDKESGSGFVSLGGMEEYVLKKGLEMVDDEKRVAGRKVEEVAPH